MYYLEKGTEVGCSVEDVIIFFSGSNRVPPTGFTKEPTVLFVHDQQSKLATSSTCDLELRLPVSHGSDYESFQEDMILSMKGNDDYCGP